MTRAPMLWLFLVMMSGCAIHSQGPIREVAYDFSDAHFYDRAYAPSPQYLSSPQYFSSSQYLSGEGNELADVIDVAELPAGEAPTSEYATPALGR
jgi:hypothetical protein